jgi:hypothetical protein
MPGDEAHELARLDYEKTVALLSTLTDVRFKLLAFVPTITGAAVALLGRGHSAAELLAVGSIGLVATAGIVVYELRNTQLYDYATFRTIQLEERLGIVSVFAPPSLRGLYGERPAHDLRVLGVTTAVHDRGLALVYGAAIGGWSYLVAWGALHALNVGHPQVLGGVVGALAGLAVLGEFLRLGARPNQQGAPLPQPPSA